MEERATLRLVHRARQENMACDDMAMSDYL
jgi:hypothetical protein